MMLLVKLFHPLSKRSGEDSFVSKFFLNHNFGLIFAVRSKILKYKIKANLIFLSFSCCVFKIYILLPPQERGAVRLRIYPLNLMQVMLP